MFVENYMYCVASIDPDEKKSLHVTQLNSCRLIDYFFRVFSQTHPVVY